MRRSRTRQKSEVSFSFESHPSQDPHQYRRSLKAAADFEVPEIQQELLAGEVDMQEIILRGTVDQIWNHYD